MNMTQTWATELNSKNIKFIEKYDRIVFYDPEESPGCVVVREHIKNEPGPYISRRIGKITFDEFNDLFPKP